MRTRYELQYYLEDGRLLVAIEERTNTQALTIADARGLLSESSVSLNGLCEIQQRFSDMCMAKCTVWCIVALVVLSWLNRLGTNAATATLCAVYGFIFIYQILHILNAKVSGFTDSVGTSISFEEKSLTFSDGSRYFFSKG